MVHIHNIPVLPLRELVVFPHSVHTLLVATPVSIKALQLAMMADKTDRKVLAVARRPGSPKNPTPEDVFGFGTVASVIQISQQKGVIRVMIEGQHRGRVVNIEMHDSDEKYIAKKGFGEDAIEADSRPVAGNGNNLVVSSWDKNELDDGWAILADVELLQEPTVISSEIRASLQGLKDGFQRFSTRSKKVPPNQYKKLFGIENSSQLIDEIATYTPMALAAKQQTLETVDLPERIAHVASIIEAASNTTQIEAEVRHKVKKQMNDSQREYYLNEQMKAIQKELGKNDVEDEVGALERRVNDAGLSAEAMDKASRELKKLKVMAPMSAEAAVIRNYIDWLVSVPWKKCSRGRLDINKAEKALNNDHYGLSDVKDRVLEYLSVYKRTKNIKGQVLCLVGPPGVGKTSLGASIAAAMNLKFTRMALGGVRDEAEIRGHRRTYIGSMPGKIMQKLAKTGVRNPLFLLDEIDKIGMDIRGDPAAALLEVLDFEQNHSFNDHYLEVDYDLSQVLFVCTSNSLNIPAPLLDRMEIIRLPGYTEDEKFHIACRHLLPKQIKANGLNEGELQVADEAITELIRHYTKEAGVRSLERELTKLCRKVIRTQVKTSSTKPVKITKARIEQYNGVRKYRHGIANSNDQAGHVFGLAWTEAGGEMLDIEAVVMPGKGKHQNTGQLGDVMQESIGAALTYIRSQSDTLGLPKDFYNNRDLHIHVPEGATPKDGPSAGIGMCTAMISAFTGATVRHDVAMTGEINLRGQVLPVGGLKEKLFAAHRGCIKTVIVPADNHKDLKEIPDDIKSDLTICLVSEMNEVLKVALTQKIPKC